MSVVQILNGVVQGSLFMVLCSGLAMIYGLRGVTNFAHGAIYMLAAYTSFAVSGALSFWAALVIVPIILALVGAALEMLMFRPLQHRDHMELGLMTFGLAMIIDRLVIALWGPRTQSVQLPDVLSGSAKVFGADYPVYRLLVLVLALALVAALLAWLKFSEIGLHVRASSEDPEIAAVLGVNTDRASLVVVALGCALAAVAGVLAAPYSSVNPGMGAQVMIVVLIIVVIGGIGSIGGAMAAGMFLGVCMTLVAVWQSSLAPLTPYALLALALLVRPSGLGRGRIV